MEPQEKNNKGLIISIISVVIIALIIGGIAVFNGKSKDEVASDTIQSPTESQVTSGDTTGQASQSPYKDGSYTAEGTYVSPGGPQKINVTLTLKNGVITDSTTVEGAVDSTSKRYQEMFSANYKQYVVGKNISTLTVGKVSGSSLTPQGFNDALAKIKTQAEV